MKLEDCQWIIITGMRVWRRNAELTNQCLNGNGYRWEDTET
jgi:hypothetical protein